jgi:AcrR family transcriptional regulator
MLTVLTMAVASELSTHQRIVDEARDLYVEAGMSGFSMRKLADRVGVTATALYRHFDSKEEVLLAVVDAGYDLLSQYLMRAIEATTPRQRLERSGESYARFAVENPAFYRIMFMASSEDFGFAKLQERSATHLRSFQMLADRVRECQESGDIRKGDARELARMIWAFSHGLASLFLAGRMPDLNRDSFVRYFVKARMEIVKGLAP